MSELEHPGADEPVVEGGTRDRGPIIVVTAISLNRAAREALAERLGPGHIVTDIKEAGNTADIVLVPSVSSMLVGNLRAMFPDARVLVMELVDDEFGIDFAGPVTRTVSSGVDGYFVVPDLDQLVAITRDVGRGSAGALTSGANVGARLQLTPDAGSQGADRETDTGTRNPDTWNPDSETGGSHVGYGPSSGADSGTVAGKWSGARPSTLVVSGPPGAGKTSVAWEVFRRWTEAGEDPAMVDLDLLGAAWPAPADDPHQARLKATNLAAVWSNYRTAGSRCLVVAALVETEEDLTLLRAAVGDEVIICRLGASDETLAARITGRARESGDDLSKLVRRAAALSELLTATDMSDFAIDTGHMTVEGVVDQILLNLTNPVLLAD